MKPLDITGQIFGRLTALYRAPSKGRRTCWNFSCSCGISKIIEIDPVLDGRTQSCGCLKNELIALRSITHGHSINRKQSSELRAYRGAKDRCYNKNSNKYHVYGARGIIMCEKWFNSFEAFFQDMGKRPKGCSLDRINVNGNYEPSNCRWATAHQQAMNKQNTLYVTYNNEKITLKECAQITGLDYKALHSQMKYQARTIDDAIQHLLKRKMNANK